MAGTAQRHKTQVKRAPISNLKRSGSVTKSSMIKPRRFGPAQAGISAEKDIDPDESSKPGETRTDLRGIRETIYNWCHKWCHPKRLLLVTGSWWTMCMLQLLLHHCDDSWAVMTHVKPQFEIIACNDNGFDLWHFMTSSEPDDRYTLVLGAQVRRSLYKEEEGTLRGIHNFTLAKHLPLLFKLLSSSLYARRSAFPGQLPARWGANDGYYVYWSIREIHIGHLQWKKCWLKGSYRRPDTTTYIEG